MHSGRSGENARTCHHDASTDYVIRQTYSGDQHAYYAILFAEQLCTVAYLTARCSLSQTNDFASPLSDSDHTSHIVVLTTQRALVSSCSYNLCTQTQSLL